MQRRDFLRTAALGLVATAVGPAWVSGAAGNGARWRHGPAPELEEITIAGLQSAMQNRRWTAAAIVWRYLHRIAALDQRGPAIHAVIELNPDALVIARGLDEERKAKGPRGPLHGIPILIKDNLDTRDRMTTTAGSLALAGSIASVDAFVVQRLRAAGAVLLGKTNLSEWANFRSNHSLSGWSGRGGQTLNPYALDRNPSGSSSGSAAATAANLCAVAVGTETDGSILSPASYCGLVGIKPTLGLISRSGIIPIAHSQDTAGPMARTVTDAALLLGSMAGVDPADAATLASAGKIPADYTPYLDPAGLRGARLGVVRQYFGIQEKADRVLNAALEQLKGQGAILVDPADLPTKGKFEESEFLVLAYEFKTDLNAYLARLGPSAPVHSLKAIIEFNERHHAQEMPYFGQDVFLKAESCGPLTEKPYLEALEKNHRLTRAEGIDAVMNQHHLDALVAPTAGPAHVNDRVYGDRDTGGSTSPAAVAGYPSITVPAGQVSGLPIGLSFFGRPYSEPMLLKLAYAFEQATRWRRPPQFLPTVA